MLETRIVAKSLSDQAYEKIVDAMARGEIVPGSRISEAKIARQFGISRGPLREAFGRLEGRGLVTRKPNVGVQAARLSARDLSELFTLREALEGMACRLAATEMTGAELDKLVAVLEKHGRSEGVKRGKGYYQSSPDEDFHRLIVQGSHNHRLIRVLSQDLYDQVRIYRYRSSVRAGRTQTAYNEHREIVEALIARDPDRAEAAMRRHIARARENLIWNGSDQPEAPEPR